MSPSERIGLVHETLTLLFHCEYVVLVEYVECMIPVFYAAYLSVLVQLPSAKYYPHTRAMPESRLVATVVNLLVYASLEVLSLVALHVVLKRKFGFSPVYLLAFVLEKQMLALQGRFFMWVVFILQFTLQHFGTYVPTLRSDPAEQRLSVDQCLKLTWLRLVRRSAGVDFTFQFAWIHSQQQPG